MQISDPLIHTKLCPPFIRPALVPRPRLQEQMVQGLRGPLTLIIAPAGFGKTTLVASCLADCVTPVAWLSLDKSDNEVGQFLNYVIAALQEADNTIGGEAAQLMAGRQQASPELVLTSLINDLDSARGEITLVLDDYQFVCNQAVHEQLAFLLEHCPPTFHLVIATRSDPPLPLARLRARGQVVELRAVDLSFTEPETAQFLNDIMGLCLDVRSVTALAERTEGWIVGLQMAALSMRDRKDVAGFIEGFSGTNRYILDYLLEEVLVSQPPEIQHFLLYTSILERLSASLCDAALANNQPTKREGDDASTGGALFLGSSTSILEYLERANLFLIPLDDERIWYRYHHLFADLLRTQLQKLLGAQGVAQLHIRAADWHGQNGSLVDAIHHASMASDEERVERFIEQNYMELVSRGEQSWLRSWTGKLSKERVYRRPWLCIYEAYSHSWFGELDQAEVFLDAAEKRIRSDMSVPDAQAMLGHLTYIKSRVTAMRGDLPRAIEFNLAAREYLQVSNLALQLDLGITLGYLYFLNGDYSHASQFLNETIRSGRAVGAILNTVAGYCIMARLHTVEGRLNQSYEFYIQAAQWVHEVGGQHLGASSLIEVGIADVLCERNDLDAALTHMKQGLALLPWWGKPDDLALAYCTLVRLHLAQANTSAASEAMEKATQVIQTSGLFPEAPRAVELARVKLWLTQGNVQAASHWAATLEQRFGSHDPFRFEEEVTYFAQARVFIALHKLDEAISLLSRLEQIARSAQRMGRVIEILLLEALAMQEKGDLENAVLALTKCLTLAEPEGYRRAFLDEGQPVQLLLAQWLAHTSASPLRDYAVRLLAQFDAEPRAIQMAQEKTSPAGGPVEPLSQREREVLHLIALGKSNQEIARQLIVSTGTVKAHTASIYRKLDVANRTQAAARARQLGILPYSPFAGKPCK
ncbi:MAG TPA: LuxR C-terminal-related transcriptional regulator [Anaerolineales bacterium]|nr:LuxR C-terminal-related transcriptional regulator [Anaerolineales bacterium]